jgi:hypothetical protein
VKSERLRHEANKIASRKQKSDKKMQHEANKITSRRQKSDKKMQHEANKIASRRQKADKAMKHEANKIASRGQKATAQYQKGQLALTNKKIDTEAMTALTKINKEAATAKAGRALTRQQKALDRLNEVGIVKDTNKSKEAQTALKTKGKIQSSLISALGGMKSTQIKAKADLKNKVTDNLMKFLGGAVGDTSKHTTSIVNSIINALGGSLGKIK